MRPHGKTARFPRIPLLRPLFSAAIRLKRRRPGICNPRDCPARNVRNDARRRPPGGRPYLSRYAGGGEPCPVQDCFALRIAALTAALLILSVATSAAAAARRGGHVPAAPPIMAATTCRPITPRRATPGVAYRGSYHGGRYPGYRGYYYGGYYPRVVVGLSYYVPYYYNYPTVNYVYTTPSVIESPSYYYSPTIVTQPPAPARPSPKRPR